MEVTDSYRETIRETVRHFTGELVSHDLIQDFEDESIGYLRNKAIGELLIRTSLSDLSEEDAIAACYSAMSELGVIRRDEVELFRAWYGARPKV